MMAGPESSSEAGPALLLVDDHRPNLLALEAILEPTGLTTVRAQSGPEALRLAEERDFVLVLMDVHMPGMDGYETVEFLRRTERAGEVPIVFLTAIYDQQEHVRRGLALGAVDYITKPLDADVVRSKVTSLVALYTRGRREERARRDEMDRLKDLVLGAVGHDLRNPLNAIVFGTRLLRNTLPPDGPHQTHVARIERSAMRMARIVEDLLDVTRGRFSGSIPLDRKHVDAAEICRNALAELQTAHPTRRLRLEVEGDTTGEWDAERFARVVSNLAGNALQHSSAADADVKLAGDAAGITLAVRNEGKAIPDDVLPRLFEPFRRGETSAQGGLGLGLFIVHEIVRAHGGTVSVRSKDGEGTTFTVRLPRTGASLDAGTACEQPV